jgi:hypothetical protein
LTVGDESNGNAAAHGAVTDILHLKLHRIPWLLEIDGHTERPEVARVMLLEALRVVEQQIRVQDMKAHLVEQAEAARVAGILARGGRGG